MTVIFFCILEGKKVHAYMFMKTKNGFFECVGFFFKHLKNVEICKKVKGDCEIK